MSVLFIQSGRFAAPAGGTAAALVLDSTGEGQAASFSLPDVSGKKYLVAVSHQGNRDATLPGGVTRLGSGTASFDNNGTASSTDAELSLFYYTGAGSTKTYTLASTGGYAYAVMEITEGTVSTNYGEVTAAWATNRTTITLPTVTSVQVDDLAVMVLFYRSSATTTTAGDVSGVDAPWTALTTVKNNDGTQQPALYIATAPCTSTSAPNEAPIVPASHRLNGGIYIVSKP